MSENYLIKLRCIKGEYIDVERGAAPGHKTELFFGLVITQGTSIKYIDAPFSVLQHGETYLITNSKGEKQYIGLNRVLQSREDLEALLAECNCCTKEEDLGSKIYNLNSFAELDDLDPKENDTAFIVFGGDTYKSSFVNGSWQTPVQINNEDIDLSAIPAFRSHGLAFAALGPNRRFRYTQDNTDGVPSPNSSNHAITQPI